jgi:hypothetical protein
MDPIDHMEHMQQILQISVNNIYLCEIGYNNETEQFYTHWNDTDSDGDEDHSLDSFKINFDPEKTLKDWFDNMKNMNNCVFSEIDIKECVNYGATVTNIDEVDEFLQFKMGDLRSDPGEVCAYQIHLTVA